MALHYDLTGIENNKELWEESSKDEDGKQLYRLNPLTDMFIWFTMFVGIPEITAKNAEKFFARISFIESLKRPFLAVKDEETGEEATRPITLEDVKRHIGLKTNASTLTKAQFLKKELKNGAFAKM
jgi:hypothetical protein